MLEMRFIFVLHNVLDEHAAHHTEFFINSALKFKVEVTVNIYPTVSDIERVKIS